MNYRTIIRENQLEITRFLKQLREKDRIFPIEGHCPALLDLDLAKFLYLGINGDHTEHSLEELEQRFANGMFKKRCSAGRYWTTSGSMGWRNISAL